MFDIEDASFDALMNYELTTGHTDSWRIQYGATLSNRSQLEYFTSGVLAALLEYNIQYSYYAVCSTSKIT